MTRVRPVISAEDAAEERLLRAIAEDKDASPASRLRALEVLERKRLRREGVHQQQQDQDSAEAADPMQDLDEMEAARVKRRRRAS